MVPKIKNIIIFVAILLVLILAYVFFINKSPTDQSALVSSTSTPGVATTGNTTIDQNSAIAQNFLSVLLNVKNINLDDSIFSNPAFMSLTDSSIVLIPDGTQGRPNPFAPIGSDIVPTPATTTPPTTPPVTPTTLPSTSPLTPPPPAAPTKPATN
jgi:hypothetical protein